MPATLLRLDHAELCADCSDLLQTGAAVVVHDDGMVSCLSCADDALGFSHSDPWAPIDDADLRTRLQHRRAA